MSAAMPGATSEPTPEDNGALLLVCTTVANTAEAQRLAHAAVEQRLAACVHIDAIESVYRWQGAVQSDAEQRLMFKTTSTAAPALRALILQLHPYQLPALYTLPVTEASAAYAQWVCEQVSAPGEPAAPQTQR